MKRPGLFRQLFQRTLILVIGAIALQLAAAYFLLGEWLYAGWQTDLGEQAAWIAGHLSADETPGHLAAAWGALHGEERLTLRAPDGGILADSQPAAPPLLENGRRYRILVGRAATRVEGRDATLIISRPGRPIVPLHPEFLLLLSVLAAMGALLITPLVRRLRRDLTRLSALTDKVAGGHFGETLELPASRELAELTESSNRMSLRLKEGEIRQKRLVADVSHELRSPMGRLRARLETAARHPEELPEHLTGMDAEIALMDRMVGDMLEMARFDEDKPVIMPSPTEPWRWASDLFARNRHRILQAGIGGEDRVAPSCREISIDTQRMAQAIGNLVDNAITAVGAQEDGKIDLVFAFSPSEWWITVADNGCGIPEPDIPHIFDRFYRVDKHRGRRNGGAGLGLSIVKAIVTGHGGKISLESEVGHGTKLDLIFPTLS